jgi:hypothetical protein
MRGMYRRGRCAPKKLAGLLVVVIALCCAATIALVWAPLSGATLTSINDRTTGTGQNQFDYHGSWTAYTESSGVGAYNNDGTYSNTTSDYYLVRFTGTGITLYDVVNPGGGQASAQICDSSGASCGSATTINDYSSTRTGNQQVYTVSGLANTTHSLKVTITGVNGAGGYDYLEPDRVNITP